MTQPPSDNPNAHLLASVLVETQMLQETIDRLTKQKTALLQQANFQYSNTKEIPTEILSHIFHYACHDIFNTPSCINKIDARDIKGDPPKQSSPPSTLSRVCSEWRTIISSDPRFWTTLNVEVYRSDANIKEVASLIHLHIKNSKHLLLDVEFDFEMQTQLDDIASLTRQDRNYLYGQELKPLLRVIYETYSNCFAKIRLLNPPESWADFSESEFEELESLTFDFSASPFTLIMETDYSMLPSLSHFSTNVIGMGLPSDQLTKLELSQIDYHISIAIVMDCEMLQYVKMIDPLNLTSSDELGPSFTLEEFTLEHLEHFEWTFPVSVPSWSLRAEDDSDIYNGYMLQILDSIYLPAVKSIVFHNLHRRDFPYRELSKFFHKLPSSFYSFTLNMRNATLKHFDKHSTRFESYFLSIPPSVTHFRLENTCLRMMEMMLECLENPSMFNTLPIEKGCSSSLTNIEIVSQKSNICDDQYGCDFDLALRTCCYKRGFELEKLLAFSRIKDKFGLKKLHLGVFGYRNYVNSTPSYPSRKIEQDGLSVHVTTS